MTIPQSMLHWQSRTLPLRTPLEELEHRLYSASADFSEAARLCTHFPQDAELRRDRKRTYQRMNRADLRLRAFRRLQNQQCG